MRSGLCIKCGCRLPGRFDDYIARTKSNGYQSLHTKVIGPTGEPLEIQIRTVEMHRTADFGIAAHWQYKEGGSKGKVPGADKRFEKKMTLLRQQLFDWQSDAKEPGEFLRSVVSDLFTDQVFVFTPKGDVLDFPLGATPIDAAYRIHSELGQHCAGAKVNGKIVPLTYHFKNGDIVEILHRPQRQPVPGLAGIRQNQPRPHQDQSLFPQTALSPPMWRGAENCCKKNWSACIWTRAI